MEKDQYVLVQRLPETQVFWSGSAFVEDVEQAIKYPTYGAAAQDLWNKIDEKFVKTRIVPIPLSAI